MMKICIIVLAVIVLGGAWSIRSRRQRSPFAMDSAIQYRATRTLLQNHRIVTSDLEVPPGLPDDLYWRLPARSALEGKYVDGAMIPSGKPVEATKVAAFP